MVTACQPQRPRMSQKSNGLSADQVNMKYLVNESHRSMKRNGQSVKGHKVINMYTSKWNGAAKVNRYVTKANA